MIDKCVDTEDKYFVIKSLSHSFIHYIFLVHKFDVARLVSYFTIQYSFLVQERLDGLGLNWSRRRPLKVPLYVHW